MSRFILSSFLVFFGFSLAQSQMEVDTIQQRLINATNSMRSAILLQCPNHNQINELTERWYEIEPNDTIAFLCLDKISYSAQMMEYYSLKDATKSIERNFPNSPLIQGITQEDIDVLKENKDLIAFMKKRYLHFEFPYRAVIDSFKLSEMKFIDVRPSEVVADIGSGFGEHALILSLMYPENNFIFNDITYWYYKYLTNQVTKYNSIFVTADRTVSVVKGKKKNLKLKTKVDKIVVRNAFHHFTKKDKMLNSIKKHLNENGTVVFIEPLVGNVTSFDECSMKISYEEVMRYIEESDLVPIAEKVVDEVLFLKCMSRPK